MLSFLHSLFAQTSFSAKSQVAKCLRDVCRDHDPTRSRMRLQETRAKDVSHNDVSEGTGSLILFIVVQLNFTTEIEVQYSIFFLINVIRNISIKQHAV